MLKLFAAAASLMLFGCGNNLSEINSEPTEFPEGRLLFVSKCSACHRLYERQLYTASQWDSILAPMQKKAKLTDIERDKIFNYLSEKIISSSK